MIKPIVALLFVVLAGCYQANRPISALEKVVPIDVLQDKSVVMIIPGMGCSSCINKALSFAKKNLTHGHIVYVISTKTIKEVNIGFNSIELANKNLIIDRDTKAKRLGLITQYPAIFYVRGGIIITKVELSAKNLDYELLSLSDTLRSLK